MNSNTVRVIQESHEAGVQFLRTELETGHTFMDVAEVTNLDGTRVRTRQNAIRVYQLVTRLMKRMELTPEDEDELRTKLAHLKRRIDFGVNGPDFATE
jgi:hypothetical protein